MAAITINQANVHVSNVAQLFIATAGEVIKIGEPVYYDNGYYKRLNAFLSNSFAGIAECGASANQQFLVCSRDSNLAMGGAINLGNIVIVGNAGEIVPYEDRRAGWYITSLGVGIGNNRMNFNPASDATAL